VFYPQKQGDRRRRNCPDLQIEHCHHEDEPKPRAKAASEAWREAWREGRRSVPNGDRNSILPNRNSIFPSAIPGTDVLLQN